MQPEAKPDPAIKRVTDLGTVCTLVSGSALHPPSLVYDPSHEPSALRNMLRKNNHHDAPSLNDTVPDGLAYYVLCILFRVKVQLDTNVPQGYTRV